MEFKELTEKDFKVTSNYEDETEYTCENRHILYEITHYKDMVPYTDFDGESRYYSHICIYSKVIEWITAKTLEESINKINQFRKKLIHDLSEVQNAKSD